MSSEIGAGAANHSYSLSGMNTGYIEAQIREERANKQGILGLGQTNIRTKETSVYLPASLTTTATAVQRPEDIAASVAAQYVSPERKIVPPKPQPSVKDYILLSTTHGTTHDERLKQSKWVPEDPKWVGHASSKLPVPLIGDIGFQSAAGQRLVGSEIVKHKHTRKADRTYEELPTDVYRRAAENGRNWGIGTGLRTGISGSGGMSHH